MQDTQDVLPPYNTFINAIVAFKRIGALPNDSKLYIQIQTKKDNFMLNLDDDNKLLCVLPIRNIRYLKLE